jgi:hypothetical protein
LLQPTRDPHQFVDGLAFTRAVTETADGDDEVQRVPRATARVVVGAERHHELDVAHRRHEARRQHANDDVLVAIEPDGSADDAGVAAEAPHPEALGEHDDMVGARALVARLQQASESGPCAKDVEEVARGAESLEPLARRFVAEARAVVEEPGQAVERSDAVAVVDEIGHVERRSIAPGLIGPHPEDAFDVAIWQLAQQHRVDHAEDRGRRAHRQRNGHDGAQRERGRVSQRAKAVADIAGSDRHRPA